MGVYDSGKYFGSVKVEDRFTNSSKKDIRAEIKKGRSMMTIVERLSRSEALCDQLMRLFQKLKSEDFDSVLAFVPTASEPDIGIFIRGLRQLKLFLPRCLSLRTGLMNFHLVEDMQNNLIMNKMGILEPSETQEVWTPSLDARKKYLMIVPALTINQHGHRLGYGGGFYDRFIAKYASSLLTVGICYEEEYNQYTWDHELHDQKLNYAATEKRFMSF